MPENHLRRVRIDRGLTVRALAREVGVAHTSVVAWEAGQCRPLPTRAVRLREVLGVPIDLIFPGYYE